MKYLFFLIFSFHSLILFSQARQFSGTWTKINTTYVFEFDLILEEKEANKVEGYFVWKVVKYDENNFLSKQHYEKKLGTTAREYVRGTYRPGKGELILKGYKKKDPDQIIGLDTYHLKVDQNGDLGGTTSANGSWLGRINGKGVVLELL